MSTSHAAQEAALASAAKITAGMTQGGAATAVVGAATPPVDVGAVTLNDIAIIVGIVVSILGLIGNWAINWYWKSKEHRLKIDQFLVDRRKCDVPVKRDRRKQDGAINRMLVSSMAASGFVLAALLVPYVYEDEGTGPTTVEPATGAVLHHAYADPAHGWRVPTICAGRTRDVFKGMALTAAECDAWVEAELSDEVVGDLERLVKVPVTVNQAIALGRFRDNVGGTQFRASNVLREANAGNCYAAAREFNAVPQIDRTTGKPRIWRGRPIIDRQTGAVLQATGAPIMKWTTGALVPLPGLIKRRASERQQFEADCPLWEEHS